MSKFRIGDQITDNDGYLKGKVIEVEPSKNWCKIRLERHGSGWVPDDLIKRDDGHTI